MMKELCVGLVILQRLYDAIFREFGYAIPNWNEMLCNFHDISAINQSICKNSGFSARFFVNMMELAHTYFEIAQIDKNISIFFIYISILNRALL